MSDKQLFAVICILLAGLCCVSFAFDCMPVEGYEGCACYTNNTEKNNTKEYVNLLPLKGNSSSPRFTDMDKDGWYISYSPCGVFSEFVGENSTGYVPCIKASVARWTKQFTHRCESLGNDENAKFESAVIGDVGGKITSNLTLKFRSAASANHSAIISLVCNDTMAENETVFKYLGTENMPNDTYYLSLTSKCCCPGKCGVPPALPSTASPTTTSKPTGNKPDPCTGPLTTSEIIVVVVGSVLIVLLFVGVLCCCKKTRDYEPL